MRRLLFASLLLSFSFPALAVYKCEAGDKITYSDAPCATGKSVDLGNKTSTSAASDIAKAKEQNTQEKKQLKELETARHKREAAEDKQQEKLMKTAAGKKKKCASLELKKKWSNEDAANASVKKQESAKRKVHRAEEKYELECGKR
ncbi:MAG TPA: DUF4124 domain-containing protein [Burkholderiaceae bacterium]|jgi:hypothetical protein